MVKKPCAICGKLITCSNMSRHVKSCHSFCQFCQTTGSEKRHICLRPKKAANLLSEYVAVWMPVLLKREVYNRERKTVHLVQFEGERKNFSELKLSLQEDKVISTVRSWYRAKQYENCLNTCGFSTFFQEEPHRCANVLPHQYLLDFFTCCCEENSFVLPERGSKEESDLFVKFIYAIFSLEGIVL